MRPSLDITLQPLAHEHRGKAAALFAAGYPERAHEFGRWPFSELARRWVAVASGELVAYAGLWRVHDDRFRLDLVVDAELRGRGIGDRVLEHLVDAARAERGATLQARADDDNAPALAFLVHRGFAETMRMHRAVLDVAGFRLPAHAADAELRLSAAGVAIAPLRELERGDAHCWERLRDVLHAAQDEWRDPDPRAEPSPPPPSSEVRARFRRTDDELADETSFVAVAGDRYVGFVGPLGTAVHPGFRNRGIATALKLRQLSAAQALGRGVLRSSSGNPAMLRVFEKLGYIRTTTEVRLVRRL
jgi:GNAT superfamily N-acetyltransferase